MTGGRWSRRRSSGRPTGCRSRPCAASWAGSTRSRPTTGCTCTPPRSPTPCPPCPRRARCDATSRWATACSWPATTATPRRSRARWSAAGAQPRPSSPTSAPDRGPAAVLDDHLGLPRHVDGRGSRGRGDEHRRGARARRRGQRHQRHRRRRAQGPAAPAVLAVVRRERLGARPVLRRVHARASAISFWQAVVAGVVGIVLLVPALRVRRAGRQARLGADDGALRAAFGVRGNKLPTAISWLLTVGWETVLTILATLATATVFDRLGWGGGTAPRSSPCSSSPRSSSAPACSAST